MDVSEGNKRWDEWLPERIKHTADIFMANRVYTDPSTSKLAHSHTYGSAVYALGGYPPAYVVYKDEKKDFFFRPVSECFFVLCLQRKSQNCT